MFEGMKRNGLAARLAHRANLSRDNPIHVAMLFEVANANYPKGANRLPDRPPGISQKRIWQVTTDYVDRGVGTLDDLFRAIWGLGIDEYCRPAVTSEKLSGTMCDTSVIATLKADLVRSYERLETQSAEDHEHNLQLANHVVAWLDSEDRSAPEHAADCIRRFVRAELDFETPGNRGIGRTSDACPRFGAKHRLVLQEAEQSVLAELRTLFFRQILAGYLFIEYVHDSIFGEQLARHPTMCSTENLFNTWIPQIYVPFGVEAIERHIKEAAREVFGDENFDGARDIWIFSADTRIHDCMRGHGMTVGDFEIIVLRQYFNAGLLLRAIEVGPGPA